MGLPPCSTHKAQSTPSSSPERGLCTAAIRTDETARYALGSSPLGSASIERESRYEPLMKTSVPDWMNLCHRDYSKA